MKKSLILLGIVLSGCTSKTPDVVKAPVCAVEDTITSGLAGIITTTLGCDAPDVVKNDIHKAIGGANLCSSVTAKGPIGMIACPLAVKAVTNLIQVSAPSSWKCKVNDTSKLSQLLTDTCIKVVPLSK